MNKSSHDCRQHIIDIAKEIISHKGFSGVGINEILNAAGVPKGSFYYYFASKEAFGVAVLDDFFEQYIALMQQTFAQEGRALDNLLQFWQRWLQTQGDCSATCNKCLVVKLSAEVSDLSVEMRKVLAEGTGQVITLITQMIEKIIAEDALECTHSSAKQMAESLYELWLGASLLTKIQQSSAPLERAYQTTVMLLTH